MESIFYQKTLKNMGSDLSLKLIIILKKITPALPLSGRTGPSLNRNTKTTDKNNAFTQNPFAGYEKGAIMEKKEPKDTGITPLPIQDVTGCPATAQLLEKAEKDGVETAFHRAAAMKPCPIGADSACCKHCAMGPCRLSSKDPYGKVGVCGATIDTIMSRNFARMVASGAAAHTDHGMSMLALFREVVQGTIRDYTIKDPLKLEDLALELGLKVEGRSINEIALEVYRELERTYIQVEGEIPFVKRVPPKTLDTWRKEGIVPRGAMREIMELMHRTHMGVDQHYENITKQSSRTALADGWGGSMVATEISDILFGTPVPVTGEVNMGVLKEDQVNIIIHGHEPNLFESMLASVSDPAILEEAKAAGAKGINLVGMCCSGLEMLSRHGIPHAGNFMSTEAVLVTGAVDALGVDVQCIQQGLAKVAACYGTRMFTTNPRCRIEGADHIPLEEHEPRACTDTIVRMAIERFKHRTLPIQIPKIKNIGVHGFSHEYINYMLGGTFRGSYAPLNQNIINGRIRGVAGVVGCTNPRVKQDWVHVELVKELIRNDVLVVQTGCSQIALAKAGLYQPEAAAMAGPGLREVCEAVGMPPVLGLGACVDNSRILTACAAMVREGGLGESIADLPVAGAAPEWMSEKAICIGHYFVASGIYTLFGVTFPIIEETRFHKLLFSGLEESGLGKWGFATDPYEMAKKMIEHIDQKRKALGIDKARERILLDMADRRSMDAS
jgi:carbon-monoxide dehydrogenase catalytic subunit